MEITPDNIRSLPENGVFVFGSNSAGRHGRGAALLAWRKFGAIHGKGLGLVGRSYGIATKDRNLRVFPIPAIAHQVSRFLRFAVSHPELRFYVTQIGCGLAGYSPKQIGPLFATGRPENVVLPQSFHDAIAAAKP